MEDFYKVGISLPSQLHHRDHQLTYSPFRISLVAIGIILMIGGSIAAGVLYSHLGYISLSCLSSIPIGALLIVLGTRSKASMCFQARGSGQVEHLAASSVNNENIVYVGSPQDRLNEAGIIEELKKISRAAKIEVLVIYGDGNVQLNTDPGFGDLDLKKVILVGACIIHKPCGGTRLDEKLADSGKWFAERIRVANFATSTYVEQKVVDSIDAALQDQPPLIKGSNNRYSLVYLVKS